MKSLNVKYKINFKLLISILVVLGVGLLALYSVSFESVGQNNFSRQLIFVGIAILVLIFISNINYGLWEVYAKYVYLFGLFMLIVVLLFGEKQHGTFGWLKIYSYHIQPVEIMKIGLILILAKYFFKVNKNDRRLKHVVITGILTFVPFALTLMQPDLGSASVLAAIWFIMLINWGIKKRHLVMLVSLTIMLSILGWFFFLSDRQKNLITVALDPQRDPAGVGYHVIQSITAIGSGKFFGKGLGHGSQSQLHFLPESHTDFIFAVIGEELGFVGVLVLMAGFLFIFYELFKIALNSADNFGRYIVEGVMAVFVIQLIVNIGMNVGMFPVIGLPLPFVSYGGSALIVEFFLIGIVFSIHSASIKSKSRNMGHILSDGQYDLD
ncbi:MAG: rod shape-determining protein RodA [Candidatus Moranbacteria bacterium]|nr:rod shape-determining protein RodA [Candidatus Moranbacteria bacterium]